MSIFSGKCDVFDHIMMEKMYDKGHCRVSDELECFEIFKAKTNGTIYQHKLVQVTKENIDFVTNKCILNSFKAEKVDGKTVYFYWGKQYNTLKQLNKKGVYIEVPIYFNTLLDIIPYYPYIITFSAGNHVVISNESYVDSLQEDMLKWGHESAIDYKSELQEHYLEVCERYFLRDLEKRTHIEKIKTDSEGNFITDKPIDYMHDMEFIWDDGLKHCHWSSPKLIEGNRYIISPQDINSFLKEYLRNNTVKIKYVEVLEKKLYLD